MKSIIFYMGIFLISTICISIKSKYYEKGIAKYILLAIGLGIIVLIATIRYNVGTDFNNYLNLYNIYHFKPIAFMINNELEVGFMGPIKIDRKSVV